jgi:hypothetical protein
MNGGSRVIERLEKRKSDDVIPMQVGEHHVDRIYPAVHQSVAKSPYTGSGIDDNDSTGPIPDLDACGVSPVSPVFLSGNGNGSPGSPAAYSHEISPSRSALFFC